VADFDRRALWDRSDLLSLWRWDEAAFLRLTEGSAIRRIGHARWQRNLAVAIGNALTHPGLEPALGLSLRAALSERLITASAPLAEHIRWALQPR
jgi:epoxyqueuosine reductase